MKSEMNGTRCSEIDTVSLPANSGRMQVKQVNSLLTVVPVQPRTCTVPRSTRSSCSSRSVAALMTDRLISKICSEPLRKFNQHFFDS